MNKFLKLHNSDDNGIIAVNKEQITAVMSYYDKSNKLTSKVFLHSGCSIAPFIVNETPSLIIKPEDTDFITLHEVENNSVVIVRKTELSVIDTVRLQNIAGVKTKIYFCGNTEMQPTYVHESVEKILNFIEGNIELTK